MDDVAGFPMPQKLVADRLEIAGQMRDTTADGLPAEIDFGDSDPEALVTLSYSGGKLEEARKVYHGE